MAEFKAKLNPFTGQLQLIPTNMVLAFKAGVATQTDLPLTGNAKGDTRIANDTGHLYVWSIDVPVGLLTDWVDAGDIVDLTWAAISGKPSSAVADIDDAVLLRHNQDTDKYLATQVTNTLYVDNKRSDVYTENGSITKPFKTIQAAHDSIIGNSATNRFEIKIADGVYYTEALSLSKSHITLSGTTGWSTRLSGAITITSPYLVFQNLRITSVVTLNMASHFALEVVNCSVSTGDWNITATAPVGDEWFQVCGGYFGSSLIATGIIALPKLYVAFWGGAIWKNLTLTHCYLQIAGTEINENSNIFNLEIGTEAHIGGVLSRLLTVNLKTGSTLYADAGFLGDITLNNTGGTLYKTTKAIDIKNTPAGTISATDVQAAIDELDTEKTTLSDVKADSDISDALSKRHTRNLDEYLATPVKNILYVDGNRSDSYTADGSITKPFKKIQDAIDAVTSPSATNKYLIEISPGAYYSDAITINKIYTTFRSCGVQGARISGKITITNPSSPTPEQITFVGLRISGGLECLASHIAINCIDCNVTGTAWVFNPTTPTDDEYLQVWGGLWYANATLTNVYTYLMGGGYYSTFTVDGKEFNINNADINEPFEALLSGTLIGSAFGNRAGNSKFTLNTGVNLHIDADTEGGSVITINGGTLTRSTKGGNISNDSDVTGITVKDALNTLDGQAHAQGTDTSLGAQEADLDMNEHSIKNVADESIEFKSGGKIERVPYLDSVTKRHTQDTDKILQKREGIETKLLMHFNGTEGSTNFIEETGSPVTIVGGGVTISTIKVIPSFGQTALFNGSGYLNVDTNIDLSGDFTLEMKVNTPSYWDNGITATLFGNGLTKWSLGLMKLAGYANKVAFNLYFSPGANICGDGDTDFVMELDTFYTLAVVRKDWRLYFLVNGVLIRPSIPEDFTQDLSISTPLSIGGNGCLAGHINWVGNIEEGRVSNVGKWTTNYTPSTTEYELEIVNIIEDGVLKRDLSVEDGKKIDGRDLSVDGAKLDGLVDLAKSYELSFDDGDLVSDVFESGTVTNATDVTELKDTDKSWTPGALIGKWCKVNDGVKGTAMITDNTSDTLTFGNEYLIGAPEVGNTYEILNNSRAILTINHNLGKQFALVNVFDNSNFLFNLKRTSDYYEWKFECVDANTAKLYVSEFDRPLTGTWNIRMVG